MSSAESDFASDFASGITGVHDRPFSRRGRPTPEVAGLHQVDNHLQGNHVKR
jgi:hypothetical protein